MLIPEEETSSSHSSDQHWHNTFQNNKEESSLHSRFTSPQRGASLSNPPSGIGDEQTSDHVHNDHGHSHSHTFDHDHGHSHTSNHDHGHSHSHTSDHAHGHSHTHSDHGHSHTSDHAHNDHSHAHNDHSHSHGHSHESHAHGHSHESMPWYKEMVVSSVHSIGTAYTNTKSFVERSLAESESRQLFFFITMYGIFGSVLFFYSELVHSLALKAFTYSVFMYVFSLLIRLNALLNTRYAPSLTWSYGHARVEVILRFASGSYACFTSTFVLFESLEHLSEGSHNENSPASLFNIFIISFLLQIISIVFIRKHIFAATQPSAVIEHRHLLSSFIRMNARPLFWNNLSSLVLLLGFFLSEMSAVSVESDIQVVISSSVDVDTLIAIAIGCISIATGYPMCKDAASVLMLATPDHLKDILSKSLKEASTIDGVLEVFDEHFWTNGPSQVVGSLSVRVNESADEDQVLSKVNHTLSHLVDDLTIQVVKNSW